ncbi:MAG: M1 family metallopeptidase [Chloroflexi bacterium]|nr:M1 family metallopeptidase [Chloroflexota bacterium]MYD48037.1 M1 family metallopeptidase [Chloroflexota bacterium]
MSLDYDVENGRLWDYAPSTIAHEVAHYYWRGNSRDWLDEGPAVFLESIAENARIDEPVRVRSNPCAAADTIAELEGLAVHRETWRETVAQNWFRCNYSLGERLFVDLYQTLGEGTFRQGFRSLWLKSQAEDYNDDCEGTDLTICHVEAAFKAGASDAVAVQVDEVLDRWYGPRE